MPVAEFAGGRGSGYEGVDLYAPHHAYGEHLRVLGLLQLVPAQVEAPEGLRRLGMGHPRRLPPERLELEWYRRLIRLRHPTPELRDGRLDLADVTVEGGRLALRRGPVVVEYDLGRDEVSVTGLWTRLRRPLREQAAARPGGDRGTRSGRRR